MKVIDFDITNKTRKFLKTYIGPATTAWALRSMSMCGWYFSLFRLAARPERVVLLTMVQISRAEGMHNDIIGEAVEVDMLEVVDKEDIALLLAGGASGTNRTEPGLRPHVVVPSLPDGVSSRLLDHVVPVSDFCFGRDTGMSMDKVAVAGSTRAVPADVGLVREIL